MAEYQLGMNAAIYFGNAGDAIGSLDELDNAREVTLTLNAGEADITTRANDGWKATAATLKECQVDFTMIWKPGDAGFSAIKDAYLNSTEVELAVLDDDKSVTGAQGPKGSFTITNFTRNEPLEEAITVSVTAKMSVFDEWHVTSGGGP